MPGTLSAKQAELIAAKQALADAKVNMKQTKVYWSKKEAELNAVKPRCNKSRLRVTRLTPIVNDAQAQLPAIDAQLADFGKSAADAKVSYDEKQKGIPTRLWPGGYADEAAWAVAEPILSAPMIAARDVSARRLYHGTKSASDDAGGKKRHSQCESTA